MLVSQFFELASHLVYSNHNVPDESLNILIGVISKLAATSASENWITFLTSPF